MTRINPDDPKWTAYVFGELNDEERAAVELELEASEEARTLVEELRFAADLTKMELREAVTVSPLTPAQREQIRQSANAVRRGRWFEMRVPIWVTGVAAAAVAVIVLAVVIPALRSSKTDLPAPVATTAQVEQPETATPAPAPEVSKPASEFELRYQHPVAPTATAPSEEAKLDRLEPIAPPPVMTPPAPGVPLPAPISPGVLTPPAVPTTGRVSGSVQDATAAYIPGVEVTATNTETGTTAKTVTNESGAYSFEGLQAGNYKVTGEMPGFQKKTEGIQLGANTEAKRDITLEVAQVAQNVEVTVSANALSTQTSASFSITTGTADFDIRQRPQGQQGQQRQQGLADKSASTAYSRSPAAPGVPRAYDRIFRPPVNGGEAYNAINDNPFLVVAQNPLSTFAIDVDTAAYSNVRRFLNQNQTPPRDAVRIEEMINYFSYDYPQPSANIPIGASIEAAAAPWNSQHRLVRIGIKARDIDIRRRPPSNIVFLLDVSGSMEPAERLPLLKDGIRMLVEQLTGTDRVTVVTYAGTTGVALQPTRGDQKDVITRLIYSLQAGGSTNGASGIQLAYEEARKSFIPGGVNRVILATDGDFNVGITDRNALLRLIEDKAKSGVSLSVLGVGMGNYKDATLETLADKGHGNYAYIDTLNEAKKVLVDQMSGTLVTVAKDVKIQVEFNHAVVDAYRLIGYENRALRDEDFNNDQKDGGDMGAGHTVTVLYEVVPRGVAINTPGAAGVDPFKYQQPVAAPAPPNASNETLTLKVRYKDPSANDSKLLTFPLIDREQTFAKASIDFRFAAAVASFGMLLRDSPFKGTATMDSTLRIAEDSIGSDKNGYRREFLQLVQRARQIRGR